MSREILDCLKRKRDICIKNIIPGQNTAFRWTPALIWVIPGGFLTALNNESINDFQKSRNAIWRIHDGGDKMAQCTCDMTKSRKKLKYMKNPGRKRIKPGSGSLKCFPAKPIFWLLWTNVFFCCCCFWVNCPFVPIILPIE